MIHINNRTFKQIFLESTLNDYLEEDEDLHETYQYFYNKIIDLFPECEKTSSLGGDEDTKTFLVNMPFKDGPDGKVKGAFGKTWTDTKTFKLKFVCISTQVLDMDDVHYFSVVAHEAAHVAAYNYIWSQDEDEAKKLKDEWDETKGHTKKWFEIINKLNTIKIKGTDKNALDIVKDIDDDTYNRYFS